MPSTSLPAEGPGTLHSRVSSWLRSQIAAGTWPAHHQLPPEPDLAAQLGISRGTLRRALSTLIAEGALVQVRGKGTFVTASVVEPSIAQKLTSLSEDFAAQGVVLTTQVLRQQVSAAPAAVAALLEADEHVPLLELVRLRSTSEGPVALLANYVRLDLAPGIETVDFGRETLFGALESSAGLPIATGRRTFTATAATTEQADLLEVAVGTPLLYLEQVTRLADGTPVEYSDVWIRSDRLRVTSRLTRD